MSSNEYETPTDIIKHIDEIRLMEMLTIIPAKLEKKGKNRAVVPKKLAADEAKKYAQKEEREARLTRGNVIMKLKSRRRSRAVENKCGREYDPILKESERKPMKMKWEQHYDSQRGEAWDQR